MRVADMFAGAGGFSTGAAMAGAEVVWAANHWRLAVDTHEANHPSTKHACRDLMDYDYTQVPQHDILLASPACQGHSIARGKEEPGRHDRLRATAWAVVEAAECCLPPYLVVENVPEFDKWALFPSWLDALQRLGYHITTQVLDSADYGVPQNRRRWFLLGSRAKPLQHPQPTVHQHIPATVFLEFSERAKWSPIVKTTGRKRAPATLARIAKARPQYGETFLMPYYGSGNAGRSIHRPIGTLTTRDHYALIHGDYMRTLTVAEQTQAMGFPNDYHLAGTRRDGVMLLGNAVPPPVAAAIVGSIMESN